MKGNLYSQWVAFLVDMYQEKEAIKHEMKEYCNKNADDQNLFDMLKTEFGCKMLEFRSKYESLPNQITASFENLDYFLYKFPDALEDLVKYQDKLFNSITISQM